MKKKKKKKSVSRIEISRTRLKYLFTGKTCPSIIFPVWIVVCILKVKKTQGKGLVTVFDFCQKSSSSSMHIESKMWTKKQQYFYMDSEIIIFKASYKNNLVFQKCWSPFPTFASSKPLLQIWNCMQLRMKYLNLLPLSQLNITITETDAEHIPLRVPPWVLKHWSNRLFYLSNN